MEIKFKKIVAGIYETVVNGVIIELHKQDNGTWFLKHGNYGDDNYWSDSYDSKKQAIEDLNKA